jgi:hypothetical protein
MLHNYVKEDIKDCLAGRRLVFIGDSTTRQVFWATAEKLNSESSRNRTTEVFESDRKHTDLEIVSDEVTLKFIWDPWLNSSALDRELQLFNVKSSPRDTSAASILLGAPGLWYARSDQDNFMKNFRDAVDRVIPYMDHVPQNLSMPDTFASRKSSPNLLLLAPIQVPRYESLSSQREETITPDKIDQMNDYLQQSSAYSNADIVWSYSRMTSASSYEYQTDGLHVIENVAARKADVLLNLRCNDKAAIRALPFDRTCCSDYGRPTDIQLAILLISLVVAPTIFILRSKHIFHLGRLFPLEVLRAMTVLGLVICLCFFADRTQLFEKSHKQFQATQFLITSLATALIGLVSMRRSAEPLQNHKSLSTPVTEILCRDQTNEWKGWMQAFILIYHYNHGSQDLEIYKIVRLLVGSYLFLTGFGHSLYFLQRQDYSLRRVSSVLIRLNLLSCVLPYMMATDYLFYYFAPLVSFWFLVVYTTLRVGHETNTNLGFLFGKLLFACALTTTLIMIPGFWDSIFSLLEYTCRIKWNSQEWRFRISLDMYIVYVGMVVAILTHHSSRIQRGSLLPVSWIDRQLASIIARPALCKISTTLASCLLACVYLVFQAQLSTKVQYNMWQPYISFIPILVFIRFRNSLQVFRNYHSVIFACLGRCSLETFVLQYHIWLAADTRGLLRIGLWNEWFESTILTIVFLWISHCVSSTTQTLTAWMVGAPKKPMMWIHSYNLASVEAEEFALDKAASPRRSPNIEDGNSSEKHTGIIDALDLKWRLVLIVSSLWICNMVWSQLT